MNKHGSRIHLMDLVILIPALILALVMVTDAGTLAWNNFNLRTSVREGARYASHFPSLESEIKSAAVNKARTRGLDLEPDMVEVIGLEAAPGKLITVTAHYPTRITMLRLIGRREITLSATSAVKVLKLAE